MEQEVDAAVLAFINEKRLSGQKLSPVEIITRMGVFDARSQASASAWVASGESVIVTVWAELVGVSAGGRWFCLESLESQRRIGGGARSPAQVQRARDRLQLIRQSMDLGRPLRAVLQANRVAIQAAESDKAAKVSVRVPDEQEWHVAAWDAEAKLAVLVRGERGWLPSDEEVAAARSRTGLPAPQPVRTTPVSHEELQAASIDHLVRHFSSYGYRAERAEQMEGAPPGYDLSVRDKKGQLLLKIAVKGLGGEASSFRLDSHERAAAALGDPWRLAVVTDAGGAEAQHKLYRSTEFQNAPGLEPLS